MDADAADAATFAAAAGTKREPPYDGCNGWAWESHDEMLRKFGLIE